MRYLLKDILIPQPKSKIKAGEGKKEGEYKFFTSSIEQTKFIDIYNYDKEALIFGTGGNANVHYCDTLFSTSTDCIVMYTEKDIELKLIYYYLKNNIHLLEDGFKGAGIKHISKDYILNLSIDLPLKCEQINILKVIENAENIILNRKQQLLKLDELVKSRFIELFGDPEHNEKQWDVFRLDTLCSVSSSKRIYQNELSTDGVPFLRISDLVNRMDTGSTDCELYIPDERYEELKTLGLVPVTGDVLLTARGTLGRCYTITERDRFYFQDGMITWLYDFNKALTRNYLTHLFTMSGFRKQIDSLQAGSTVAYLSISMTKKLNVMLPPLELQNQFATFVEQTDKSKLAIQQSLEQLETLKKSLMQQYFG